ncbi:MAG: HAMP domain-containing protein [Gemmatimonadota bacterium]|nr:HAMP domain-containing protein [Gemmatimonadota bacterium]
MAVSRRVLTKVRELGRQRGGRLSRRLLVWFLLFSLVPLLITNAVGYQRSKTILEQLVDRYLSAVTRVQVQHVRDRIDHHLLLLQAIVTGNQFLAAGALRYQGRPAGQMGAVASLDAVREFLVRKQREISSFDAIDLYTTDGRVIASAGDSSLDVRTPLPDWAQGGTLWTALRRGAHGPEPVFQLAVPLTSAGDPRPVAYLGATVSLASEGAFLEVPAHVAGRVESFIVDSLGHPLFVSNPDSAVDYTRPLATPLLAGPPGAVSIYTDRNGVPVIGTMLDIPGYPWRFVAEVPEVEAFGELRRLGWLSLIFESVFVAVLVAAAWVVAWDIVAPLERLVSATRRVGRGDLSVRVAILQRNEIGELGQSFNEMTAALAQTTARVDELHRREIERASQLATVGELASGVAHEIRNPVVGVSNGLDLVRRRVGPDPVLEPIVDEMSRQLTRIQGTLQELLAFARPATPTLTPLNVNDVVERAVRLAGPATARGAVRVEVKLDPAMPRIAADEEMLHQALVNVIMNALQATPAGGLVTVATRHADGQIDIEIADTGCGIPSEHLAFVFRPFYTTRHTGTGLGLPITREIIQRHGGTVSLASRVNAGTTITLRLPIRKPPRGAAAPPEVHA